MNEVSDYTNKQTRGGERNHLIDVIKGICIIFVIINHYDWNKEQWNQLLFPFWVVMAVPIFMIISGYVGALSFDRKGFESLSDCYQLKEIISKCLRFTIPFLIMYLFELYFDVINGASVKGLIVMFFTGGNGPGGYYFPVMIQFVFLFPIIYIFIKREGFAGLLFFFILNAIFEILQKFYGLNEECYRLIILRYLFVIAFGCYLYLRKNEKIKIQYHIISFCVGIGFILLFIYSSYKPQIITYWTGTSFLCCLYVAPIVNYLFRINLYKKIFPLEILGRASFNIFLIQKLYFFSIETIIQKFISNVVLLNVANIMICCIFGVLFYLVETPLTNRLIMRIRKSNISFEVLSKQVNDIFCKEII